MLHHILLILSILPAAKVFCSADGGYHYDAPRRDSITRHHFQSLPTISPLPAIPQLPSLPTGPIHSIRPAITTQYHYHHETPTAKAAYLPPANSPAPVKSFISAYVPPKIAIPPPPPPPTFQQLQQQPQLIRTGPSNSYAPPAPVAIHQPLVNLQPTFAPDDDVYVVNGRSLKQYSVVEIIDNDIEEQPAPPLILPRLLASNPRAFLGASGTGAAALPIGQQVNSRSNALLLEQQRAALQLGGNGGNNAIALGSGGLGYIRLPNGSVSLGSGSLGYISSQQRSQSLADARTRSGANQPDALHFGHGPLGGTSFFFG